MNIGTISVAVALVAMALFVYIGIKRGRIK